MEAIKKKGPIEKKFGKGRKEEKGGLRGGCQKGKGRPNKNPVRKRRLEEKGGRNHEGESLEGEIQNWGKGLQKKGEKSKLSSDSRTKRNTETESEMGGEK